MPAGIQSADTDCYLVLLLFYCFLVLDQIRMKKKIATVCRMMLGFLESASMRSALIVLRLRGKTLRRMLVMMGTPDSM